MLPSYVADVVLLQWEREDPSSYRLRTTFKGKSKSNFLFLRVQLKHKLKIFPERRAVEKATSDETHQMGYRSIFLSL